MELGMVFERLLNVGVLNINVYCKNKVIKPLRA